MQKSISFISSCIIGNILEFYDFVLYGVFAIAIAQVFFPPHAPGSNLMATFAVLSVGYLSRPIGGILFGHFGDKISRRKTLIVSLLLMGVVTFCMGILPGYATLGIFAPILLVLLRLTQGLTVGGESAGSSVFLFEQASPRWQASLSILGLVGSVAGVLLALAVSMVFATWFSQASMLAWGWRLAFILSLFLAIIGVLLRWYLWQDQCVDTVKLPVKTLFTQHGLALLVACLFLTLPAIFTGFLFVYLVPFLMSVMHFSLSSALSVTLWVMVIIILALLAGAFLSDYFQCHKRWMQMGFGLLVIVAYPLFFWMQQGGAMCVAAVMLFALIASLTMGPEIVFLAGLFKRTVRFSGVGFSHGLMFSVITGLSPLLFHYLVVTAGVASIGVVVLLSSLFSLISTLYESFR